MRKLLFTIIILTFTISSSTQIVGLKAGLNMANISGDNTTGIDPKFGVSAGIVTEFELSDVFSLQPEFIFSSQGYQFKESLFFQPEKDIKIKINYLNFPVMAKFYVIDNFSIEVGPQLGLLLSEKRDDGDDIEDIENTNFIDFGMGFGLGYKMNDGMFFQLRYNLGFSNINDSSNINDKNQHKVLNFSIGYNLN